MVDISIQSIKMTWGNIQFLNFSEASDAISFPLENEISKAMHGASGTKISVGTGMTGGPITAKFLLNSPTVILLNEVANRMKNGEPIPSNPIICHSTELGITLKAYGVCLSKHPQGFEVGAGAVGEMVYSWDAERITMEFLDKAQNQ